MFDDTQKRRERERRVLCDPHTLTIELDDEEERDDDDDDVGGVGVIVVERVCVFVVGKNTHA